ncbi:MAG: cytochrome C oxidase subunit IV family protein [Dehalococcoidia bacterium]
MTSDMAHGEAQLPEVQHKLPAIGPRQYVMIGVILTIITAIELWVSYSGLDAIIIPVLLVLSAVKFAVVVAFFMHLRFDSKMLTRLFVFGLALASAILVALTALFWNDSTISQTPVQEAAAGSGGGEAAAGGAAAVQAEVAVALGEFFVTVAAETSAGGVQFNVANEGAIPHNLRVARSDLAPDALPVAAGIVDEAQVDVVASTVDVAAGASDSATATLEAGAYVLFCNVPGHYQLGMHAPLTVR